MSAQLVFAALPIDSVRDPHAQGRRLARRLGAAQALGAIATAAVWLLRDHADALGALMGGGVAALGTILLGVAMFGRARSSVSASRAFAGLIAGSLVRWMTIAAGLGIAIGWVKLPPFAVVSGLIVALAIQLFGMRLQMYNGARGSEGNSG